MNKIIFYTLILMLSITVKALSQTNTQIKNNKKNKDLTFEKQIENIATSIEFTIFREKNELKMKIDSLESDFENKLITAEELNAKKINRAELTAKNIETLLDLQRVKIDSLIQDKVNQESNEIRFKIDTINGKRTVTYFKNNDTRYYEIPEFKIYKNDIDRENRLSKRTTSQFIFAMGLNNLITQGENLENSDYRVWGSHFYEWGLTYNTRILKNANLLHAKYGFSVMYNNLRPTSNRLFVKNGNQTNLENSLYDLSESRLRNVQLVFPIHLEFDFSPKKQSKDGKKSYFRTHESIRMGFGGYGGFNIKSKQITKYKIDGDRIKDKQKGNFNTSDFVYGLSTYIGYKQISLYVKYDINPLFKNNTIDQNNVSLGIRFDFN